MAKVEKKQRRKEERLRAQEKMQEYRQGAVRRNLVYAAFILWMSGVALTLVGDESTRLVAAMLLVLGDGVFAYVSWVFAGEHGFPRAIGGLLGLLLGPIGYLITRFVAIDPKQSRSGT